MAELRMEIVEWRDANFSFDDHDWEELDDEYVNATIGWTRETEKWLVVVSEITPGGERAVTRIPIGNVLARKRLAIVEADVKKLFKTDNEDGYGPEKFRSADEVRGAE